MLGNDTWNNCRSKALFARGTITPQDKTKQKRQTLSLHCRCLQNYQMGRELGLVGTQKGTDTVMLYLRGDRRGYVTSVAVTCGCWSVIIG